MKSTDFKDLELMREGIAYQFEIKCRKFSRIVRPLTNYEIIKATAAAAEDFQRLPELEQTQNSLSLLNAMHQLVLASAPDVNETPTITLALLQMMNPEEVNHLWKQYVRAMDRVNPSFEEMKAEDLSRIAEDLKKNSDPRSLLIDLSISSLIALCLHLSKTSEV